jgi:hypothetical protein
MDITTQNYLEAQFFQIAPLPVTEDNFPHGFDIQICNPDGRKTNYLRITAEQMKRIEYVIREIE